MPTLNLSNVQTSTNDWARFSPSPQQSAIREWVLAHVGTPASANVIAVAGSGKTTTLRWICQILEGSVAFAAYNKKIADEIAFKLQQDGAGRNIQARTFHSFGMAAWNKITRAKVDGEKMEFVCEELGVPEINRGIVKRLVGLAKNHAFGVQGEDIERDCAWRALIEHFQLLPDDLDPGEVDEFEDAIIGQSIAALRASIAANYQTIDFDDMLFAPLFHQIPIYQNDWVLVDEAQDTNPARRMLARRMLKPGGRLIAVGDPHQAIYGFTGADADALDIIQREFKAVSLPLTVSYRCPKKVVAHAQQWVSHIESAPGAPDGEYRVLDRNEFKRHYSKLDASCAILCRLTKPLVQIAFELIRKRISCHVEGRDIGRNLITLTKRYPSVKNAGELYDRLCAWGDGQISRLTIKKKEAEAQSLQDKLDTLGVFIDFMDSDATVFDLRAEISKLFDDTPEGSQSRNVTLSTVHKAKGREWPTVYLYGRTTFMPSRFAKQQWQIDQEHNLIYVAVTRSMDRLFEIDLNAEPRSVPSGTDGVGEPAE